MSERCPYMHIVMDISYAWPSTSVCTEWDQLYLSEMCRPSSSEAGRRHLRSTNRGQLVVPRYRLTTAGRKAFSCVGPSAWNWNSLPEYLTVDTLTLDYFKRSLKCFLFARYLHSAWRALGICYDSALYKCTLNNNKVIISWFAVRVGSLHSTPVPLWLRSWRSLAS